MSLTPTQERDSARAEVQQLRIQHDALRVLYDQLVKDLAKAKEWNKYIESLNNKLEERNDELRVDAKAAHADKDSANQERQELLQQYNSQRQIVAKLDGYVTRIQEMDDRKFLAEHPTMQIPRQQEMAHPNLHVSNYPPTGMEVASTFDWTHPAQQRNKY